VVVPRVTPNRATLRRPRFRSDGGLCGPDRVESPLSRAPARTEAADLHRLVRGMSVDARRAFVLRGFGPAVLSRLTRVEGLTERELESGVLTDVLTTMLEHAGVDASMLELFHLVGGVPWRRCLSVARSLQIAVPEEAPEGGGPAEHAREAVVLTVDGPPQHQFWSTGTLMGALQSLHRHLESEPSFRLPAARPILAGVSEDERHLILRADPPTTRAVLALSPAELRAITGLPVRSVSGGRSGWRQHRWMVLGLTLGAVLLLGSVVGKQWQLTRLTESLRAARTAVAARQVAPPAPVVEASPAASGGSEPAEDGPAVAVEPADEGAEDAAADPGAVPPPVEEGGGLSDVAPLDLVWARELEQVMSGTDVRVEVRDNTVVVAFSGDLIAFQPGESSLSEAADRPIRAFAGFLRRHRDLRVWVEGHTDAAAYSSGNWLLGARRALAVVERLAEAGVPPQHIALTSHGEHHPIASNTTAAGRRKNRRVELVVARPAER